ncbi:MAG: glycosyltransferase family 2 protein [Lachnospiraceae bacterium]|nr:glycosyltransferase family 2 protein [Lachnospiraceae bacterium]
MEKNYPKVSIIVPIYNGEKTLKRCIESILQQTYADWELILISDGSTDRSNEICKEYEKTSEKIRFIYKENEGVSATRNRGLKEAKGIYVQFVDCDDYLEKDYLKKMELAMEQEDADMVIAGYTRHKNNQTFVNKPKEEKLFHKQDFAKRFFDLYNCWLINTPWNKIYKREKIKEGFPIHMSLGEDLLFNLSYLKENQKVYVIEEAGYQYCIEGEGSLGTCYRDNKFETSMYLHKQVTEFAKQALGLREEKDWKDEILLKELRISMVNLVKSKVFSKSEKLKKIKAWCKEPEVKKTYKRCSNLSIKERIFGFLVVHNLSTLIYLFFKL